jgi:hypothetical protein
VTRDGPPDPKSYDNTRRYHIDISSDEAVTATSSQPRELYVEYLISQSRNSTTDVLLGPDGVPPTQSVPPGGTMVLMLGETYNIRLEGSTATNGYEQIESYINFPNTIFQINSVTTTYTAVPSPHTDPLWDEKVYADGCTWENDPTSPNYRSCFGVGKYGGSITVTYNVTIIGGVGTSETLNTLIYDFSGSSYHYNSDFSAAGRIATIVNASIEKSFSPKSITPGGTSALTFTINNPGLSDITSVHFTDDLSNGAIYDLEIEGTTVTYTDCGSPSPASLTDGEQSLSFTGITVAAQGTCIIDVTVTATTETTITNATGNLFIDSTDTGDNGSDILVVSSTPPPPDACAPGTRVDLATWTMPTSGQGSGGPPPPHTTIDTDVITADASAWLTSSGSQTIVTDRGDPAVNSWAITDAWLLSGTPDPTNAPYFQFLIDSSNYGGLQITFNHELNPNGAWAAQNEYFVFSSPDGSSFTQEATASISKSWETKGPINATNTGVSQTWFRIMFVGRKINPPTPIARALLDTVTITGCPRPEAPSITKAFGASSILTTTTTSLTFSIYNPNVSTTLTGIQFTDTLPAGLDVANSSSTVCGGGTLTTNDNNPAQDTVVLSGGSLAAGDTCTFSVTVTGTTAGLKENSVTVASENGGTGNTAYANLLVRAPTPSLSFLKQVGPTTSGPWRANLAVEVNDPVYYRFVIENTGDVDLTNVTVTDPDPNIDPSTCSWYHIEDNPTPPPDEQNVAYVDADLVTPGFQLTIPIADASDNEHIAYCVLGPLTAQAGSHTNNADADSDQTTPVSDSATYATVELTLAKSALPLIYNATGDIVTYTYQVTNSGSAALPGPVTVSDDKIVAPNPVTSVTCDAVSAANPGDGDNIFEPGEVVACTADYTITAGDVTAGSVTNTATATVNGFDSNDDSETVELANPELTVDKTSVTTSLSAPGTVTYNYLVTNTGNVTLTGISLSDDNDNDDMNCGTTTLAPSATTTCTATHTFTQTELDDNGSPTAGSGFLTNNVTASSNEAPDATDSLGRL